MYQFFNNVTNITREIIKNKIVKGNVAIDATVGNGKDTLLLANLVGSDGKVYGFDIQESAIINTKRKLIENKLSDRVYLIKDGHENMDNYVDVLVDLIVFNLGYLPGGDHKIVTKAESTIIALKKSLQLLKENGLLLVNTYTGHSEGKIEEHSIKNFFSQLNQKEFNVLKFEFINQINNPPILYGVEKNSINYLGRYNHD